MRLFLPLSLALLLLATPALGDPFPEPRAEIAPAPKTTPTMIAGAWDHMAGPDNVNIAYIHAAADKFNLNPSVLAAAVLTDVVTHQSSWVAWGKSHPEVRSGGHLVHIGPEFALQEGLLRTDLLLPLAREKYNRKKNDINLFLNPKPGVDHWYESYREAAHEFLMDDGAAIGAAGRKLRRSGNYIFDRSRKLSEPYQNLTEPELMRMLSKFDAWPDGSSFDWDRLNPGRQPWTVPTFALVYGNYRASAFDGKPADELLALSAQVYQWVTNEPEPVALLAIPEGALPLEHWADPPEDYSFQ